MLFNDFLLNAGIAPAATVLALHRPANLLERREVAVMAEETPELFLAYQSTHPKLQEATLKKRAVMASFVARAPRELVFAGLFAQQGWRDRSAADLDADPIFQRMMARFGGGWTFAADAAAKGGAGRAYFYLAPMPHLSELRGRIVVSDPGGRNHMRLAETTPLEVLEITRDAGMAPPLPDWALLCLSAAELSRLPRDWAARLRDWRGIYLIVDESDGARYVGAAYGQENLLGRWQTHVAGEIGVTRELEKRRTEHFRFTILQRLSPDATIEEVTAAEQSWIERLHTRRFGLNT